MSDNESESNRDKNRDIKSETKRDDQREVKPGSARAKLEAFDRKQKGNQLLWKKLLMMGGILFMVLALKLAFDFFTHEDRDWYQHPKNIAWMMREGHWDRIEPLISKDVKIIGGPAELQSESLISFLRSRGDRLPVFATYPHRFGDSEDGHWLSFFATWARGNLSSSSTVPLIQTWLINAEIVERDGNWVVVQVEIRPTIAAD